MDTDTNLLSKHQRVVGLINFNFKSNDYAIKCEIYNKLTKMGVVTYKNSGLDKVVDHLDLEDLLLETDAPYLTPVPLRGQRNESAHIYIIAKLTVGNHKICTL